MTTQDKLDALVERAEKVNVSVVIDGRYLTASFEPGDTLDDMVEFFHTLVTKGLLPGVQTPSSTNATDGQ